jgi:hypothetical protein
MPTIGEHVSCNRLVQAYYARSITEMEPMPLSDPTNADTTRAWCPVIELRQYTLYAGKRNALIELFDRDFIESQEVVGLTVMGQFRDLSDPNKFVWLRGFSGIETRSQALAAFYDGPVWMAHRDEANATMIDSDNVLLLRPARAGSGFREAPRPTGEPARRRESTGVAFAAIIYYLEEPAAHGFLEFFEDHLAPALTNAGLPIDAYYVTEASRNDFPRLPVRENEPVLVFFSRFLLGAGPRVQVAVPELVPLSLSRRMAGFLRQGPEIHCLVPTPRSRLPAVNGRFNT